jgi:uncharacterized protein YoxC
MIHRKPKLLSVIVGLSCIVSSGAATLGDDFLEADVQARLQKMESLRGDYERTIAEGIADTPELQRISAAKAKYTLDQYNLLLDAQARAEDAQRLRDAQERLMDGCAKEIDPIIHSLPAMAKLEDINRRIKQVDQQFAATRGRVTNVVQAAHDVQEIGDRVEPLKQRATALQAKIVQLQDMVNGQKDPGVKAHNQGLLDKAGSLLKDLQGQIAALDKASARANARLADATGVADEQQALAAAARIRAGWNRASRQRDEALAMLSDLRDIAATARLTSFGTVSRRTLDGQLIPVVSGQPVTIFPGESIVTGASSGVTVQFTDGSRLILSENSNFTSGDGRTDATLKGGLLHRIERLIGPARRRINTPDCVIAERGTDYVLCTDEKKTWCAVASGQVELAGIAPSAKPVIVNPMQRATLKAGQVDWQIETLTADDYERLVSSCDPLVN